jgi:serine protease Do
MTSWEIDSYLILLAPDGRELAQDDDSGGGSNSRISFHYQLMVLNLLMANSISQDKLGLIVYEPRQL